MKETFTIIDYYDTRSGDNVRVKAAGMVGLRAVQRIDEDPYKQIIDITEGELYDALRFDDTQVNTGDNYAQGAWQLVEESTSRLRADDEM